MTYLATVEKLCVMRCDALSNRDVSLADAIGRRLQLLMLIHAAKKKSDKRYQSELRMLEHDQKKQLKRKCNQSMFDAAIEEQKLKIADIVSSNLKVALKTIRILANNLTLSRLLGKCTTNQITTDSGASNCILFSHFARDNTSQIDSLAQSI
jgi:Mg2+/Co2+ transporter CorB